MITLEQARQALVATPPPEVRLAMDGADLYGVITGISGEFVDVRFEGRTWSLLMDPADLDFPAAEVSP